MLEKLFSDPAVLNLLTGGLTRGVMDEVRKVVAIWRKTIESYSGPREFEADWKWLRLMVPLQVRLLVEQILWDKRGGWRDLVTGFGPVKGRRPPASKDALSARRGR